MIRLAQTIVAAAVLLGIVWFEETYHHKFNPYMVLACAVLVPYLMTQALMWLLDRRHGGEEHASPPLGLEPAKFSLTLLPGEFTRTDRRRRPF